MTDIMSWSTRRLGATEGAVVLGILALVGIAATSVILYGIPLGWDEALYASKSRSLVTDIPASIWRIYRPPGLPLIGLLGGPFGFSDASLRAVTLILGLLTLMTVWAFTRILWGALAAIIALVAVIGAPIVRLELVAFHTDLPSTGLSLLLMLLLWHEFERRPQPTSLVLAAAPIAAAAFHLRYGSVIAIGAIGTAALLLWHGPMLRSWRLIGATLLFAGVLFAPHVVQAMVGTGSPIGIITSAGEQVDTTGPLVAAYQYLEWLPTQLAHVLGFAVIVAGGILGTITMVLAARRRVWTPDARRYVWLFVPAGITAVGLILRSHPEPRYMLFPIVLGIIAGAGAVSTAFRWIKAQPRLATRARALDVVVVGGILLAVVLVGLLGVRRMIALERDSEPSRWQIEIGHVIDADADGPCTVATTVPPIIGWYSGCDAVPFSRAGMDRLLAGGFVEPTYVVLSDIDERRSTLEIIGRYRTLVDGPTATRIPIGAAPPGVAAYRLNP